MTSDNPGSSSNSEVTLTRHYKQERTLKYGVNPHQHPALILSIEGSSLPFQILNGTPGYINLLDALNAWQLVSELKYATQLASAASFKHVSPAGAAVATPLNEVLAEIYDAPSKLTPAALAYLRARQADPKCSFGDFVALSEQVDEETALLLKREVSDGIIAPNYTEKALEILKQKKNGAFIILRVDANYKPPSMEYREVFGTVFAQRRNDILMTKEMLRPVTVNKNLSEQALTDLLVASITAKYTQSNSVVYALDGQVIGVGAGQQSRVDCVKLAGSKVAVWWMRQHARVRQLRFKADVKRVERTNARMAYIEGEMSELEQSHFESLFEEVPPELTPKEKKDWMKQLSNVSLASDAFFPFRDNIDVASRYGVKFISNPGGSIQDEAVKEAANEYGMCMCLTGVRLFHH